MAGEAFGKAEGNWTYSSQSTAQGQRGKDVKNMFLLSLSGIFQETEAGGSFILRSGSIAQSVS